MNSPEPEDEEVLLVEEVVAEDAEEVAPVEGPRGGAVAQGAGHLGAGRVSGLYPGISAHGSSENAN